MYPIAKAVNYSHLFPTRYTLELEGLKGVVGADTFKEPSQREDAKKTVKKLFEERYVNGKNRWFFQPLRVSRQVLIAPSKSLTIFYIVLSEICGHGFSYICLFVFITVTKLAVYDMFSMMHAIRSYSLFCLLGFTQRERLLHLLHVRVSRRYGQVRIASSFCLPCFFIPWSGYEKPSDCG